MGDVNNFKGFFVPLMKVILEVGKYFYCSTGIFEQNFQGSI